MRPRIPIWRDESGKCGAALYDSHPIPGARQDDHPLVIGGGAPSLVSSLTGIERIGVVHPVARAEVTLIILQNASDCRDIVGRIGGQVDSSAYTGRDGAIRYVGDRLPVHGYPDLIHEITAVVVKAIVAPLLKKTYSPAAPVV